MDGIRYETQPAAGDLARTPTSCSWFRPAVRCNIRLMEPTAAPQTQTLDIPRIVRTPGTCGGKPRIDGHRIKVEHIAICYGRMGMSPDEIVASHPTITLAQVHAALADYYQHKDEIDADIEEGKRFVEEMKAKSPPSKLREVLEARKANGPDNSLSSG